MIVELPRHTLVIAIGPSGCGKTTYITRAVASLKERYPNHRFSHVSSDAFREQLATRDLERSDSDFMQNSSAAFDLLYATVKANMSYPVNHHVVFVDSTGLSAKFRGDMVDMARDHQYNVMYLMFDYKRRDDYFIGVHDKMQSVTHRHVTSMKRGVPEIMREASRTKKSSMPIMVHKVPRFGCEDTFEVSSCGVAIEQDENAIVIGDVHGNFAALMEVLSTNGIVVEGGRITSTGVFSHIVLVGDYIDGDFPGTVATTGFIHSNLDKLTVVVANHEHFVVQYGRGKIKGVKDDALRHFPTIGYIQSLGEDGKFLAEAIGEIYDASVPYITGTNYIITHAPCENKYLGKDDPESMRQQRNVRWADVPLTEVIGHVAKSDRNHPTHICGHISIAEPSKMGSVMMIDTGAKQGGKLSYATIINGTIRYGSSTHGSQVEGLPNLFDTLAPVRQSAIVYDEAELWRAKRAIQSGVYALSPTMRPADKRDGELESLDEALSYYIGNGVPAVLQVKYMGSNALLWMLKDDAWMTSRNGFRIDPEYDTAIADFRERVEQYIDWGKVKAVLFGTELMPWSALGKGLIESTYQPIIHSARSFWEDMRDCGWDDVLENLRQSIPQGAHEMSTRQLVDTYGHHVRANILAYERLPHDYQSGDMLARVDMLERQIQQHGQDYAARVEGFAVYKVVMNDGSEWTPASDTECPIEAFGDNERAYNAVSGNTALVVRSSDDYEAAKQYLAGIADSGLEGVVVKPLDIRARNILPFIKVRTPDYLHIPYGFDYRVPSIHTKLLDGKRVRRKGSESLRQWDLMLQMLSIPYGDVPTSDELPKLICQFRGSIAIESGIDPRF